MKIDKKEIEQLTEEYGGQWGINHTRRLLQLISVIGEGLAYDAEALRIAAHLHDWGGYNPWAQKDVDHALRSGQVAEGWLAERGCQADKLELILEAIRLHHTCGPDARIEAILLSDADALDFLGVVGVLRDFSKNTRDMRKAYEIIRQRRDKLPGRLILEKSREIALVRLRQMDALLENFEQDTWGFF